MALSKRQIFLNHIAQTSDAPLMLEIERAEGMYMYDVDSKKYMDLIAGISVSNIGHCHPEVVKAVQKQAASYMHLMVYGEYIQTPQNILASLLTSVLPENLNNIYFCNSGTEATEGAMKLAKRFTGRTEIISFENGYHGSTQGALSLIGDEYFKSNYRPLLPSTRQLKYNCIGCLDYITNKTAAVFVEPVQAESGITPADKEWLQALRQKCNETGALLVFDEIQSGLGRTGYLFAINRYNVIPDILTLAKGLGAGMPIGAFISSKEIMSVFMDQPVLGHITTFGGHPVNCAAAAAGLSFLLGSNLIEEVKEKEVLFLERLKHPSIKKINHCGLWLSLEFENYETNKAIIDECIANGLITDWFLFSSNKLRIAPPLIITKEEIEWACSTILKAIQKVTF